MFYSAYLPVVEDRRLPALHTAPPLLREHRLYQADWLLRYYHFSAQELLTEEEPNFDPYLDPKCTWAVRHPEFFPVEVNTAGKEELLRVPGIGPKSAIRILQARRTQNLGMAELKRIGGRRRAGRGVCPRHPRRDRRCPAGPQGGQRGDAAAFAG